MADNDKNVNTTSMKILGYVIGHNLDMTTQICNVCINLHYRLYNIKELTNITNMSTRLVFGKLLVLGKLIYTMPLYTQLTLKQLNIIHKVIMTSAMDCIGTIV